MLAGLSLFVHIDWGRVPLFGVAIVAGGAAFAAFGAAIGGAAREVRASSLLAFMISLPIAFVSLVESGTVSPGLFDVIKVVRALFPFHAALDAMSGGLDAAGPAPRPADPPPGDPGRRLRSAGEAGPAPLRLGVPSCDTGGP